MRLRHLSAAILIGWLGLAAIPAQACVAAIYYFGSLQDPDEVGIDAAEKARREAQVRAHIQGRAAERLANRADAAAQWSSQTAERQADWLVRMIVPDPVVSNWAPCTYGPSMPDAEDAVYLRRLHSLIEEQPIELGFRLAHEFMRGYQDIALGCNQELVERLEPELLAELPRPVLSRVVGRIAFLGFYPPSWGADSKLFRYSAGPVSPLELIPREWHAGNRPPLWEEAAEAEFRTQWPLARAFWQTDSDAIATLAAIQQALNRLRDDSQPYWGFCPQTVERVEALAQEQRDLWPQMVADLPESVRLRAERRRQILAAPGE